MNNLKQNLAKLAKEFCNKEIPDFNELFHEDPTTDDLEINLHRINHEITEETLHLRR
uniref:Uncharacterized protein n=1 Tax=Rhizophagus irregularis (strain DAOM 181602 / DAOM 197198 / MUCL 43194) TaxID=747089 RepID=U9UUD0_RHIID